MRNDSYPLMKQWSTDSNEAIKEWGIKAINGSSCMHVVNGYCNGSHQRISWAEWQSVNILSHISHLSEMGWILLLRSSTDAVQ